MRSSTLFNWKCSGTNTAMRLNALLAQYETAVQHQYICFLGGTGIEPRTMKCEPSFGVSVVIKYQLLLYSLSALTHLHYYPTTTWISINATHTSNASDTLTQKFQNVMLLQPSSTH